MSKTQVYFIRHGLTDWNLQRRLQGHSDIPLNQQGQDQATQLGKSFSLDKPELIYSSDLLRAHKTAQILAQHWQVPVQTTPDFREIYLGQAEGLTREKMIETYGEQFVQDWGQLHPDFHHLRLPEGESKKEAAQRFHQQLLSIANRAKTLAIVSHGLILKTYVHLFSDPGLDHEFYIPNLTCIHCELDFNKDKFLKIVQVIKPSLNK